MTMTDNPERRAIKYRRNRSRPWARPWANGRNSYKTKEANTMENPTYRITVEVIGDEKDHELGDSLRGG